MKTKEELNALKEEAENLKLHELNDVDLDQVRGGVNQNPDGTYFIQEGSLFFYCGSMCIVMETYRKATMDTLIKWKRESDSIRDIRNTYLKDLLRYL